MKLGTNPGYLYFITSKAQNAVKVGFAVDLDQHVPIKGDECVQGLSPNTSWWA